MGKSPLTQRGRMPLKHAGTILDHAPDLAGQVVNGDLALDAAYREATGRRDRERNQLEEQERRRVDHRGPLEATCTGRYGT